MKHRKQLVILLLVVVLAGSMSVFVWQHFQRSTPLQGDIERTVAPYRFHIFDYEVRAVSTEFVATLGRPGTRLTTEQQLRLVRQYLLRAQQIATLEDEVARVYADSSIADPADRSAALRTQLAAERHLQAQVRPVVEAILQRQVSTVLQEQGLTTLRVLWPPLRFNFSEPPNYLIVSPRQRIEFEAGIFLQPALDMSTIAAVEEETATMFDRSTLIEPLGGLGVWPTMVIDRGSLRWTISTVAHEWVHNYMVFHPLGWHLLDSAGMNTVSETVATIVGDEIGDQVAYAFYGLPLPEPVPPQRHAPLPQPDPNRFDFRTEMRRTRLRVDELLAQGDVTGAEAYMEARRRVFVEHGYALRKLNQAYFAFHGSYATQPAASDPLGPKLQELRSYAPNLATFVHEVQQIKRIEDVDTLLAHWRQRYQGESVQTESGSVSALAAVPGP